MIEDIKCLKEFAEFCFNAYNMGWHERNGGNLSCRMTQREIDECQGIFIKTPQNISLNIKVPNLKNEYFMVTSAGFYFSNILKNPHEGICIIRVNERGDGYYLMYAGKNSIPTSELASHLMNHNIKITKGDYRVIYHAHPENIIALTFILPLNPKAFSNVLWRSISECAIVFPEGVGVLPWMMPGSDEIAEASAKAMEEFDVLVWANHGIFSAGKTLDEAFSMIHTVEKAAKIYLLYSAHKELNTIENKNLIEIAKKFGKNLRTEFLD